MLRLKTSGKHTLKVIARCNYLKCRIGNHVRSQTVVTAIMLCLDGSRKFGGIDCVDTESRTSWREFLLDLRRCSITGVSCTSLAITEDLYGQFVRYFPVRRSGGVSYILSEMY